MKIQLLRDKSVPPDEDVLKNPLYLSLTEGLQPEWRYYNDGKAWLCKVGDGRKTIFWFSVWEDRFQVAFYFPERHLEGLAALGIEHGRLDKEWGRMIPLIFEVRDAGPVAEIRRVVEFKRKAK
jgi:hypothetical protein